MRERADQTTTEQTTAEPAMAAQASQQSSGVDSAGVAAISPASQEEFSRYAALRDTILELKREMDELNPRIKAGVEQGIRYDDGVYHAEITLTSQTSYPLQAFRAMFGDELTLRVAEVNAGAARELANGGTIDPEALAGIAEIRPRARALRLVAHERKSETRT